jgi:hypothetical protein
MSGSHAPRPRKNKDTLHRETWLRHQYLGVGLSPRSIGHLIGCSEPTVRHALRKFSIPMRTMSEAKTGRPNNTVWTAEMREALAAKRRGSANPMYGTKSPWAGRHKPYDQETRHYGRGRARVLHPPGPCEVCGKPNGQRHHIDGDTSNNRRENIVFLCPRHHLHLGHNGHWGSLNPDVRASIQETRITRRQEGSMST